MKREEKFNQRVQRLRKKKRGSTQLPSLPVDLRPLMIHFLKYKYYIIIDFKLEHDFSTEQGNTDRAPKYSSTVYAKSVTVAIILEREFGRFAQLVGKNLVKIC